MKAMKIDGQLNQHVQTRRTTSFLLVLLLCSSSVSADVDVDGITQQLQGILHEQSIPPNFAKLVAMLEDSMDILQCIPTTQQGNCYYSGVCRISKFKVDDTIIPIRIGFCKKPYKIIITPDTNALESAFIPGWARDLVHHDIGSIVINFQDYHRDGVCRINSDQSWKAGALGINLVKVRFLIDATLRYDCTKPRASTPLGGYGSFPYGDADAMRRCQLNSRAPGGQYNKVYYDVKVRFEYKKKRFNWGKLNYKCKKCADMVNKSGVFGISGPDACIDDVIKGCQRFRPEPRCGSTWC